MHPLPRAILFDLDDTLISFHGASHQAWQDVCTAFVRRAGLALSPEALYERIMVVDRWYWSDPGRHFKGRMNLPATRRAIVARAFAGGGESPHAADADLSAFPTSLLRQPPLADAAAGHDLADAYSALRTERIHLLPDVPATLAALRGQGLSLALLTNGTSDEQRGKVARFGLAAYFDVICIEGEQGFGKPDPAAYEAALRALGVSPGEAWMVGDNLIWDIEAPQALGIFSVWRDPNGDGLPKDSRIRPNAVIQSVGELPALLSMRGMQ